MVKISYVNSAHCKIATYILKRREYNFINIFTNFQNCETIRTHAHNLKTNLLICSIYSRKDSILGRVVIYVHPFEDNFDDNLVFLSSYWSNTMEREKGREEEKNIMCVWERKLFKSYHKMVVQISFLFLEPLN